MAEHGRNANYVRKLQVNPSVRIKIGRALAQRNRPRDAGDDPRGRQRAMPAANAAVVRIMGTDLLTVRVDLDPERRDSQARPTVGPAGAAVPPAGP